MLRVLFLFLALIGVLLCIPAVRARVRRAYGERNWRELKQHLALALALYFLISLVVTLYKYNVLG